MVFIGKSFKNQLEQAFKMKLRHEELLAQFTAQFDPGLTEQWMAAIEAWNLDSSKPNPYEETERGEIESD